MDTFTKLFGSLLTFVYHCFDRIVILGHMPLLTRPENIVHFFRDVHQASVITKDVLRQGTGDYNRWVDTFARKQRIPIEWAQKGVRKEDYVRSYLQRMERQNRFDVYFISQEHGGGAVLPLRGTEVPGRGSELPHHCATALSLHPLLFLHPR